MRVFDCHCDTAMAMLFGGKDLAHNDLQISLDRAEKLDGYAQFFGHFTSFADQPEYRNKPDHIGSDAAELFEAMCSNFLRQVQRYPRRVSLCTTAKEAETAAASGKTAAFLSIEGAEAVGCDPGRLEDAYRLGVRMVSLTWNFENALAGSCKTGGGLTAQGREFVRRAQDLGMLVDVSHCSDETFWDVCDITRGPVVASHSNARALCDHARNLTDDMFRELCQTGGFAGINLYTDFLGRDRVTLDTVRAHMDHFLDLSGGGHVGLGGDLDGCETLPEGFTGVDDYAKLYEVLLAAGMPQGTVDDIFYNTVMEVVKQVCGI